MRYIKQSDTTFEEINQRIWKHREERDWLDASPRGLAVSIAIEAAELLEHYQWTDKAVGDKEALADELADVLIYSFEFAQAHGIDVAEAITRKLTKTAAKYPSDQFKNKTGKEKHQTWLAAHHSHRQQRKESNES